MLTTEGRTRATTSGTDVDPAGVTGADNTGVLGDATVCAGPASGGVVATVCAQPANAIAPIKLEWIPRLLMVLILLSAEHGWDAPPAQPVELGPREWTQLPGSWF